MNLSLRISALLLTQRAASSNAGHQVSRPRGDSDQNDSYFNQESDDSNGGELSYDEDNRVTAHDDNSIIPGDPLKTLANVVKKMKENYKQTALPHEFGSTGFDYPVQRIVLDLLDNAQGKLGPSLDEKVQRRIDYFGEAYNNFLFHSACAKGAIGLVALFEGKQGRENMRQTNIIVEDKDNTYRLTPSSFIKKGSCTDLFSKNPCNPYEKNLKKLLQRDNQYVTIQYVANVPHSRKEPDGHAFVVAVSQGKLHLFQSWVTKPDIKFHYEYPNPENFMELFDNFLKSYVKLGTQTNYDDSDLYDLWANRQMLFDVEDEVERRGEYQFFLRVSKPSPFDAELMEKVLKRWRSVKPSRMEDLEKRAREKFLSSKEESMCKP